MALAFCEYPPSILPAFVSHGEPGIALHPLTRRPTSPVRQEVEPSRDRTWPARHREKPLREPFLSSSLPVPLTACFCLSHAVSPLHSHSQILLDEADI